MAGDTKAVLEAVQNIAAATGRPVCVLLGQRTPCSLDEVLALPNVCAVARGPREDEGVAVFAEGTPLPGLPHRLPWRGPGLVPQDRGCGGEGCTSRPGRHGLHLWVLQGGAALRGARPDD